MPAPAGPPEQSVHDFLRAVRASGLIDAETLEAAIVPWKETTGPVPDDLIRTLVDRGLLSTWQIDQLRKNKHKGFFLGKYKLIRELGAGGMSKVFLGEDTNLHSKVAIKVLPPKKVDKTSYLDRFEREARTSARLNHPNIAKVFHLESAGPIHFMAIEYIDGTDLQARVKENGPLPIREAAEFIRQAALGLHYAHEEGLVHRDIKPANLMVDKLGHLKILDLGLALSKEEDDASLTREHNEKVLGTADYLAPEQAKDSHNADRRADIYALGCTLHYLLLGTAPFAKGSLGERIRAHMRDPAPNLLEKRPDVPASIAELYFRMMEKHPDARPQTAKDVADALTTWLTSTVANAPRPRHEPPNRAALRRSTSAERSVNATGQARPASAPVFGSAGRTATPASTGGGTGGSGPRGGTDPEMLSFALPQADGGPAFPGIAASSFPSLARGVETAIEPAALPLAVGPGPTRPAATKAAAIPTPPATRGRSAVVGLMSRRIVGLPGWAWLLAVVGLAAMVTATVWSMGRKRGDAAGNAAATASEVDTSATRKPPKPATGGRTSSGNDGTKKPPPNHRRPPNSGGKPGAGQASKSKKNTADSSGPSLLDSLDQKPPPQEEK